MAVDTYSVDWQLTCWGRHICRMSTKPQRIAYIDMLRTRRLKQAGDNQRAQAAVQEFIADLERRVREQWPIVRATSS
nr:MAG TPA: hypothetical protein [Caudoviricetes sp.]